MSWLGHAPQPSHLLVRLVVGRELSLPEVAAAHAEALAVRIRVLRLRHAVLTAVAERGLTVEETDLMHKLAQLSEDERRRLIGDFLESAFGGLGTGSAFAGIRRSVTLELPDDAELRRLLLARLESVNDPRRDRYVQLLAVINGWPAPQGLTPVLDWAVEAVRVRVER